ncbi:MAG: enoyl-CoA hydratase/isomerase family protein [Propionibacteriaceae bacterium]|nr:enoyl-CoA hydratase/isomerase family protein [Propionibacteriaceae bacterium]
MTDAPATWFGSIAVSTVVLPGREHPSALLRLGADEPRRPVLWTLQGLDDLTAALHHVRSLEVEAVVLAGNEHSFGSGADLNVLNSSNSVEEATEAAHRGWRAFRTLADLPIPSFALITGFALGGGLELALFADHRVARSDTRGIGLPEVGLGILPGWGGAWQIARLAGAEAAVATAIDDSLRGRTQRAAQAMDRGIVDAVLPADDWDATWPTWVAARIDAGKRPAPTPPPAEEWEAAVVEATTPPTDATTPPVATTPPTNPTAPPVAATTPSANAATPPSFPRRRESRPRLSPAPEVTLGLIQQAWHQDVDTAEPETSAEFGKLLYSDIARTCIYAQGLTRRKPVVPDELTGGTARPIDRVAIIGAGLMASQLAALIARQARIPVVLTDLDNDRAQRGVDLARGRLERLVKRGTLTADAAEQIATLITATTDPAGVSGADLVIEAIFEDLDAKRAAFAAAEPHLADDAVLATNTSSLSITAIAEGLAHPERVIGFHVFNPVDVVPLLEIIPGARTGPDAVATALDFGARLHRSAVFSADAPGFIVNRVLTRMFDVSLTALDAGQDPATVDAALDPLGLPMTPLQLLDFVGPAVQLHVSETMHTAFPDRFTLPDWLARVVSDGHRHVLTDDGTLSEAAAALLPRRAAVQESTEALLDRALEAMAEEIRLMLDTGVVSDPAEVDRALILGANWPRELGGITPYLDRTGASERTAGRRFHPPGTVTLH